MIKVKTHKNNNWLKDAGYSLAEEQELYDKQLQDIMDNTRWYLDNFEYLPTYRLSWVIYTKERCSVRYIHRKETAKRKKHANVYK